MPEKPSPETEERIRALCRQISVAHNLDDEIQREMYSHMEDKLLGYLSGEEKVTEEDAFILVKEHFGELASLKGLLREVHALEAQESLFRRIGAVLTATLAVHFIGLISFYLAVAVLKRFLPVSKLSCLPDWVGTFIGYILPDGLQMWIPVMFLWFVLVFLKKRVAKGEKVWFYTLNKWKFSLVIVLLLLSPYFLAFIMHIVRLEGTEYIMDIIYIGKKPHFLFTIVSTLFTLLQCVLWLWWSDCRSWKRLPVFIGLLVWTGYMLLPALSTIMYSAGKKGNMDILTNILYNYGVISIMALIAFILYQAFVRPYNTYKSRFFQNLFVR
jgi:hypothetical protein